MGVILFLALGLVLNFILNDSEEAKDVSKFKIPENGGALATMKKDEDGNVSLKLVKKIKMSEDTWIFRFGLDEN